MFGIQDPYVIATTLPSRTSSGKTKYDEDGGTDPVWEASMQLFPNEFDDALQIEVWNANLLIDSIIGAVEVPLSMLQRNKTRLGLQLNSGGVLECSFTLAVQQPSATPPAVVEDKEITDEPCMNPVLQIEVCARLLHTAGSMCSFIILQVQRAEKLKNPSMFSCTVLIFHQNFSQIHFLV